MTDFEALAKELTSVLEKHLQPAEPVEEIPRYASEIPEVGAVYRWGNAVRTVRHVRLLDESYSDWVVNEWRKIRREPGVLYDHDLSQLQDTWEDWRKWVAHAERIA